jgi:hypothetical protein
MDALTSERIQRPAEVNHQNICFDRYKSLLRLVTTPNSVQTLKLAYRQVTLINWPNVHPSLRWLARQCTAHANFFADIFPGPESLCAHECKPDVAWSIPLLLRLSFHAMVLEGLAIAFQSGARGAEGD